MYFIYIWVSGARYQFHDFAYNHTKLSNKIINIIINKIINIIITQIIVNLLSTLPTEPVYKDGSLV